MTRQDRITDAAESLREHLGQTAHAEFLRQVGRATDPDKIQKSWLERGESNKEQWRRIADAVIAVYEVATRPGETSP